MMFLVEVNYKIRHLVKIDCILNVVIIINEDGFIFTFYSKVQLCIGFQAIAKVRTSIFK